MNVRIQCSGGERLAESGSADTFWIINGSVYGLLQAPPEFVVCSETSCSLDSLLILVVQTEMNGYTFQCVNIDHRTVSSHLGEVTMLEVVTLPEEFNGGYS